jgi:hypothetical protein
MYHTQYTHTHTHTHRHTHDTHTTYNPHTHIQHTHTHIHAHTHTYTSMAPIRRLEGTSVDRAVDRDHCECMKPLRISRNLFFASVQDDFAKFAVVSPVNQLCNPRGCLSSFRFSRLCAPLTKLSPELCWVIGIGMQTRRNLFRHPWWVHTLAFTVPLSHARPARATRRGSNLFYFRNTPRPIAEPPHRSYMPLGCRLSCSMPTLGLDRGRFRRTSPRRVHRPYPLASLCPTPPFGFATCSCFPNTLHLPFFALQAATRLYNATQAEGRSAHRKRGREESGETDGEQLSASPGT